MTYIERKGRILPVGARRNIHDFNLTPARGSYRSTDHAYKMVFVQTTASNRSNHINDDLYLSLVDFQTILSRSLDEIFLVGEYIILLTFQLYTRKVKILIYYTICLAVQMC